MNEDAKAHEGKSFRPEARDDKDKEMGESSPPPRPPSPRFPWLRKSKNLAVMVSFAGVVGYLIGQYVSTYKPYYHLLGGDVAPSEKSVQFPESIEELVKAAAADAANHRPDLAKQKYMHAVFLHGTTRSGKTIKSALDYLETNYADRDIVIAVLVAHHYFLNEDFDNALKYYDTATALHADSPNPHQAMTAYYYKGQIWQRKGNTSQTLEAMQKAFDISVLLEEYNMMWTTASYVTSLLQMRGQHKESIKIYQRILQKYQGVLNQPGKKMGALQMIEILRESIGDIHQVLGEHEEALRQYGLALATYDERDAKESKAFLYTRIINGHLSLSDPAKANETYARYLKHIEKKGSIAEAGSAYYAYANFCHYQLRDFEKSEEYFTKATTFYEKEAPVLAQVYSDMAALFTSSRQWKKMIDCLEKAAEHYTNCDQHLLAGTIYERLGNEHKANTGYAVAADRYFSAMEAYKKAKQHLRQARMHHALADVHQTMWSIGGTGTHKEEMREHLLASYRLNVDHGTHAEKVQLAEELFQTLDIIDDAALFSELREFLWESYTSGKNLEKLRHLAASLHHDYRRLGLVDRAKQIIDEAFDIAKKNGDQDEHWYGMRILAGQYQQMGLRKESLALYREVIEYKERNNLSYGLFDDCKLLAQSAIEAGDVDSLRFAYRGMVENLRQEQDENKIVFMEYFMAEKGSELIVRLAEQGSMDEAQKLLREMLGLGRVAENYYPFIAPTCIRIAAIYRKAGDSESARKMLHMASGLMDSGRDKTKRADLYAALAELLQKEGDENGAAYWLERLEQAEPFVSAGADAPPLLFGPDRFE